MKTLLRLLLIVSYQSSLSWASDVSWPVRAVGPGWPDHHELYDVRPYEGLSDDQMVQLFRTMRKIDPFEFKRTPKHDTYFVDDEFREVCDFVNAVSLRGLVLKKENGSDFDPLIFFLNLSKVQESAMINSSGRPFGGYDGFAPREAYFYLTKQLAWFKPFFADRLSKELASGKEGLVPCNLEWATYWRRRADALQTPEAEKWAWTQRKESDYIFETYE